jgi:hypothetical protein
MIQIIEIKDNSLVAQEKIENIKFLPRLEEVIPLHCGIYQVKGVAHMWDAGIIKIMVNKINE